VARPEGTASLSDTLSSVSPGIKFEIAVANQLHQNIQYAISVCGVRANAFKQLCYPKHEEQSKTLKFLRLFIS
jgi:hypothetical protein